MVMKTSMEYNQLYAIVAYSQKAFRIEDPNLIRRINVEVNFSMEEESADCSILYGISASHQS